MTSSRVHLNVASNKMLTHVAYCQQTVCFSLLKSVFGIEQPTVNKAKQLQRKSKLFSPSVTLFGAETGYSKQVQELTFLLSLAILSTSTNRLIWGMKTKLQTVCVRSTACMLPLYIYLPYLAFIVQYHQLPDINISYKRLMINIFKAFKWGTE